MGKNFEKFWKELYVGNFKNIIGTSLTVACSAGMCLAMV